MLYKATELLASYFENNNTKYSVRTLDKIEGLTVSIRGTNGCPDVSVQFISHNNNNDVSVRVFGLATNIPDTKRFRVLEACNSINCRNRFIKYVLNNHGDITLEYDCPCSLTDDNVAVVANEILIYMLQSVKNNHAVLMKALYTDDPIE